MVWMLVPGKMQQVSQVLEYQIGHQLTHDRGEYRGTGLDPLPPAKATDAHLPTGPYQNDSDLAFRGVLPVGPGPYLPDESPGLLS